MRSGGPEAVAARRGILWRLFRAVLLALALATMAAGTWVYRQYRVFADAPLAVSGRERSLHIELGTPFNRIVARLRDRGLTEAHPLLWRALAWEMGVSNGLHAGEYELAYGLTPRTLLRRMASGDVIQHDFTIVEGWTFRELRAALARDKTLEQTLGAMSDAQVMEKLGAAGLHPEGRFLPETYAYTHGQADLDVLRRAYQALRSTLDLAWKERAPDLPLANPDEALILASIVEKETGRADERPRIAGVFVRRMRLGMKLQTDPTVIYGLGAQFDGNLTRAHLDADTPYNTYSRTGLPPTPIAMPGAAAIRAVLEPADGDELYFVARGDGSHEFTPSLQAHQRAVAKYQLRRR